MDIIIHIVDRIEYPNNAIPTTMSLGFVSFGSIPTIWIVAKLTMHNTKVSGGGYLPN
jgi:hypothetical protein